MYCEIKPVRTRVEWNDFLGLPSLIYSNSELAKLVPPEMIDRKFNKRYNPFLAHIEWNAFLAQKNHQVLGRIVASIDHLCPEPDWGFFGFFECVKDKSVACKLLQAAANWLKEHHRTSIYGPISLSTSDNLGCLVEGFREPNPYYLPYNPPYYHDLLISSGYDAFHDLYAYSWENSQELSERLIRIGNRLRKSSKVNIRPVNYRRLRREAQFLHHIYNRAMVNNWGHVPLTEEEAYFILASHRRLIPPEYFLWAEVEGKPVGLCMAQPNFTNSSMRLILLAVKPEYNHLGLSALLITTLLQITRRDKITKGELSFVQEGNMIVNKLIQQDAGSVVSKRYRLYKKALT